MTEYQTESEVVADLTRQSVEPHKLDGGVYAIPGPDGSVRIVDTDAYSETPRHTTASRTVLDATSFVTYVNRHGLAGTEVYADTPGSAVVAIIDSHEGNDGDPGWQKHRLTLSLEHTKAWKAWVGRDLGQVPAAWMDQQEFAEFIEDRALDVVEPDHATLIELATKFEATKNVEFGSSVRLDSGEVQFQYTETIGAKKGNKGEVKLPKEIKLALRPYIGGPIYFMWAALRYRMGGTGLRLGYALQRPENILEAAFADIVTEIREGRTDKEIDPETKKVISETVVHQGIGDVPIFYGRP
jgi:uncharacterized protein YfdQ (DUF2303 family)